MKKEYKVKKIDNNIYGVVEITTIYGKQISAYDSESNVITNKIIYEGNITDCLTYIILIEKKLLI